nr:hypothetical protein [Dyadobacter sp. NIV53]
MNNTKRIDYFTSVFISLTFFAIVSCNTNEHKLPILGERDWVTKTVDGKEVVDTIYNTVPPFTFVNQYSDTVSENIVSGKIYVTDFFLQAAPQFVR